MRANIFFVKERFDHFNSLCFEDKLPKVRLRMSSSLRTLGTLRYPRQFTTKTSPSEITLSISNRLDQDVSIIEDTIIHEMIHLYILWFRIKDTSTHGEIFKRIMTHINRKHNRHITITHKGSVEEKTTDRILKPRLVLVSKLKSGEDVVTVCSPRFTLPIFRKLSKSPVVRTIMIIVSYDPIFAHYPASRTPKIYNIDPSHLEKALKTALFYEYKDGKLKPKLGNR